MKNLSLFTLLCLFLACQQEETPEYTTINGQLETGTESTSYSFDQQRFTIKVAADGSFHDTLHLDAPRYFNYTFGDISPKLYLSPGDALTFSYTEADSLPVFSGTNAAINNYLYRNAHEKELNRPPFQELFTWNEEKFLAFQDSVREVKRDRLANISNDEFKAMEHKALDYRYQAAVVQYVFYHGYLTKKNYEPSPIITSVYDKVNLDNEADAQLYTDYQYIVRNQLEKRAEAIEDSTLSGLEKSLVVLRGIKSPTIRKSQLFDALYSFDASTENIKAIRDTMLTLTDNEDAVIAIQERYDLLAKLQPGSPSPSFDYENYQGGNTQLADLKGKYLYVDIWATWCGPCIEEIPHLKKVEKEFKDANIEFVSISIDELGYREKWRKMIVNRELGGTQLLSDKNWESDFIKSYGISGIPHFILLDDKGNIVSADVERPSDPGLKERLQSLNL